MTEELEREVHAVDFVAWLAGDVEGGRPRIDGAASSAHLADALVERLQEPGTQVMRTLERLSAHPQAKEFLPGVLSEQWRVLAGLLGDLKVTAPPDRTEASTSDSSSKRLIYLVLRFADPLPGLFSADVKLFASACYYDRTMLRHLLIWAGDYGPGNPNGWHFGDDPPPESIWEHEAERWRLVFSTGQGRDWSSFDWVSSDGLASARRLVFGLNNRSFLYQAGRFFSTQLDGLIELAKLNVAAARSFAADSDAWSTFAAWVDQRMSFEPRMWLGAPTPTRVALALPILPVAALDEDADQADQFAGLPEPDRAEFSSKLARRHLENRAKQVLAIGWATGLAIHERELPRTIESVRQVLERYSEEPGVETVSGVALLWADLIQLVDYERNRYEHRTEIRGVAARLTRHMALSPAAWACSTGMILRKAKLLGTEVTDLLALAAVRHQAVRQSLEEAGHGPDKAQRDLAQGLIALVEGVGSPGEDLRRWLADTAAQAFDGVPFFPHPLTPLARTWLGATEVEEALGRALQHAGVRFADAVCSQGGAREELLTGMLVTELQVAFRDLVLRLEAGGRPRLARTITVSHRPTKAEEEKRWGCDIALLLKADIPPSVSLRLAELVQVKKSEALGAKASPTKPDKWRIDVPQLLNLLRMSESASYWLIASSGDLACVTARWIRGLVAGREALNQASVTIGYNDVRHTAVALNQFIPELLLGTWVGSIDETTLRFAEGDDDNLRPRHIFEITVQTSTDHQ